MPNDDSLRDILHTLLRIESRLDGHDQRFESIDQRFDDQREQINSLTEFTVTSLNSISRDVQTLNDRTMKLEMNFEDFRSDTRAYWVHLSDTRTNCSWQQEQLKDHEIRINKLEVR